MKKVQAIDLLDYKRRGEKLACCTAYDFTMARLLDLCPQLDLILLGDSLANTQLGLSSTTQIGMPEVLHHLAAVRRGVQRALLCADMPFASYQVDLPSALASACELIKAGAECLKIEGADVHTLQLITRLYEIGIPTIGHLGYTPQATHTLGYGRIQGKDTQAKEQLLDSAQKLEAAGAVAVVLELIPAELGKEISQKLHVPTIGIGAGKDTDGQILVLDDLLGLSQNNFKFVRKYANLSEIITEAIANYAADTKNS